MRRQPNNANQHSQFFNLFSSKAEHHVRRALDGLPSGLLGVSLALLVSACATPVQQPSQQSQYLPRGDADKLLIVDCLLPGQVRKLGRSVTYLTPRRPAKTSAGDCEIRGGEYVAYDRANFATALDVWQSQADEGDAKAQTYVGEIYERGLGRPADSSTRWPSSDFSRAIPSARPTGSARAC
jgi:TPR repeat protein